MSIYSDMLDALAAEAEVALATKATRDPSVVGPLVAAEGGCVFVQFPTHVGRLMAGPNLEVPVSLITAAPSDLKAMDWLLDRYDALVEFCGARGVTFGPVDIGTSTYPAITATAQIALDTTGA